MISALLHMIDITLYLTRTVQITGNMFMMFNFILSPSSSDASGSWKHLSVTLVQPFPKNRTAASLLSLWLLYRSENQPMLLTSASQYFFLTLNICSILRYLVYTPDGIVIVTWMLYYLSEVVV